MLKGDRRGFIDVDRNQYLWERDFPINIKNPKGKQTTFKITFELDNQETDEIRSARGLNIYKYITLVFYFDKDNIGNYDVSMRGKANKIYNSNTNKQFIAQYIAQNLNPIYVPCVRPAEMSDEAFEEAFKERLREKLDTDTEYKNCLQIIQEKQTMILQELEEELEETIKKYIPKVEAVRYERISTSGHRMVIPARGHLYIDDGVSTMLELKGDGIKSLTAIALKSATSKTSNSSIFCVEEPESHLHSDAIYGIKKILKDASAQSQVIITSHSPIFIDKEQLNNNIVITQKGIHRAKKVAEIKEILGVHVSDEFKGNELLILVEGVSDERVLESLLKKHCRYKNHLESGKIKIVNMKGATKASNLVVLYNSLLMTSFVVLDNDKCGNDERKKLLDKGLIENSDYFSLSCSDRAVSELEDFVLESAYADYIKTKYYVDIVRSNTFKKDKAEWSERLKKTFMELGKSYDKEIEDDIKEYIASCVCDKGFDVINPHRKITIETLLDTIIDRCEK